jgi:acyl CoA:acetate/3-ketoacid CoA transferase beta subunit
MGRIDLAIKLLKNLIRDREALIFVGVGEPLIIAEKYKKLNPKIILCLEAGAYDFFKKRPDTIGDGRILSCSYKSDTLGILSFLGRRNVDIAIIGGVQVDYNGNVNSTLLDRGEYLAGSGGASDFFNGAKIRIVVIPKNRIVKKVYYKTSVKADFIVTDSRIIYVVKKKLNF